MHQHNRGKNPQIDMNFRMSVAANIDSVIKRAETMACKLEREQVCIPCASVSSCLTHAGQALQMQNAQNPNPPLTPIVQTVVNLISNATNPMNLAKMGEVYVPWF